MDIIIVLISHTFTKPMNLLHVRDIYKLITNEYIVMFLLLLLTKNISINLVLTLGVNYI